jgi:tripartite-type tricarboxylate transporter receptor subunit TctC
VKSAQDLVMLGKSKPGELTFASTGVGTPGHLNGELFSRLAGLKAVHVPYRVVGQAVTDFVAGRIAFWIAPIPTMLQNVRQGQLKPLAVAGGQRSADLPGIPTVQETGIGNFDASTTYALFAPPGTPRDIVDWVHSQIGRALEDETVQQKLRAAGVTPKIGAPEEVTKMLEWRIPEWAEVIKSAGIKIN